MSEILVATKTFAVTIDGTPRMFRKGETRIERAHPWFDGPLKTILDTSFQPASENLTYTIVGTHPKPAPAPTTSRTPAAAKAEPQRGRRRRGRNDQVAEAPAEDPTDPAEEQSDAEDAEAGEPGDDA